VAGDANYQISQPPFSSYAVIDVLDRVMGFSRAFADALSFYATGVSQAHLTAFETIRRSPDDLRLQDLQTGDQIELARPKEIKRTPRPTCRGVELITR
jgi:hypothetical protein